MSLAVRSAAAYLTASVIGTAVWAGARHRMKARDPRRNSAVIEAERIVAVAASRIAHPSNRENKGTS